MKAKAGVVGVGVIGATHIEAILRDPGIQLVGITDAVPALREAKGKQHNVPVFADHIELIEKGKPDFIVVCTPHYSHTDVAIDAMKRGVHVLSEKPLTVSATKADEAIAVAKKTGMLLGVNFLSRLNKVCMKMHELIAGGVVGRVTRVTMVRTDWFRSMTYYRSSAWRATWAGEGGGIIVNQSPHDLDLINWLAGLPSEVYAEINTLGHDIEVEDDVVALLKWSNGATGSLHVTTNEAPGTNSIEIAGTRATLLYQKGKLRVTELTSDAREFSETTKEKMSGPPIMSVTGYEIPDTDRFLKMSQNMVAAIRKGVPLVCPAEDGVKEVELANALLISGVKRKWVKTPPSRREFDSTLAKLIELKSLTKAKAHYAR